MATPIGYAADWECWKSGIRLKAWSERPT